jgi:hypothetical protein
VRGGGYPLAPLPGGAACAWRSRSVPCCCLPLLAFGADSGPLGISYVDTADLRPASFRPEPELLVPHTARTFSNALDWQRRIFGWTPSERTTIWLRDFSDYGNAGVSPAPNTLLRIDVAPAANAFETNPSNERMYSTMNHEMVHVATTDIASAEDRRWRRLLLGKVAPQSAHPESLLYSYLTVPRFTVPRWYLEGSAVFMETWMAGGQGRAQGGYDEMVFRAMVRDDAHFYDPLGLASRGTRVDFQVGANAYLVRRPLLHLAGLRALAVEGHRLAAPRRRQPAPLRRPVRAGLRLAARGRLAGLDRLRARVPAPQSGRGAQAAITSQRNLAATALGSVSRAFFDEASACSTPAFAIPARSTTWPRSTREPARRARSPTSPARCCIR